MAYNFTPTKNKLKEIENWLHQEYLSIRTGRATPQLLDSVQIDSYGSKQPVSHVAAVSVDDPKTLRISPWDQAMLKPIETAIAAANLGVSTIPDGKTIRVIFPELTSDRRKILLKLAGEKLEEAKVSVRGEREHIWNEIQAQEKAKQISEDDKFRFKDELQKLVDECVAHLVEIQEKKEKEIES